MSLAVRVNDLATRVATEFKTRFRATWATDPLLAGYLMRHVVNYATTGGSSTIMEFWYTGSTNLSSLASFWLNENGAPRAAMPKPSDSALKVVGWGIGQSVHTFVIEQRNGASPGGTGGRSTQWAMDKDGNVLVGANEVKTLYVCAIASTDTAPPAGFPVGHIVLKRRA